MNFNDLLMKTISLPSLIILSAVFILSCKQSQSPDLNEGKKTEIPSTDDDILKKLSNDQLIMAVLYHQVSAEMKAVAYQTFALAKFSLDEDLKDKSVNRERAVIVDIDETLLDNSPFEAKCILDTIMYPLGWSEWCSLSSAIPIPGAIEFLNYAVANGVDIFYITNRKEETKAATIENLKKYNFPSLEETHLFFRTEENSKETRRKKVAEKFHISLLIGDNLADFSFVFEGLSTEKRSKMVEKYKKEFGRRFIILPNAMYGDWEGALYNHNYKQSAEAKAELRRKNLQGF